MAFPVSASSPGPRRCAVPEASAGVRHRRRRSRAGPDLQPLQCRLGFCSLMTWLVLHDLDHSFLHQLYLDTRELGRHRIVCFDHRSRDAFRSLHAGTPFCSARSSIATRTALLRLLYRFPFPAILSRMAMCSGSTRTLRGTFGSSDIQFVMQFVSIKMYYIMYYKMHCISN